MNILLVSNEKNAAGAVRASMYAEQFDDIEHALRELGFKGDLERRRKRGFKALEAMVAGDYDSITTINEIQEALRITGHEVKYVDISDMASVVRAAASGQFDKVFNYAEGLLPLPFNIREVEIPLLTTQLQLSHTASHPNVSRVIFDKYLFAQALTNLGIATPSAVSVVRGDQYQGAFPVFAKPQCAGSGVGIGKNKANTAQELDRIVHDLVVECLQPVIVQPLIEGATESTVPILPYKREIVVFPPMNIFPPGSAGYTRVAKFGKDASKVVYELEPDLDLCEQQRNLCLRAYKGLGMRGVARFDIMRDGKPQLVEANQPAGLYSGGINLRQVEHDPREILQNPSMSDLPKAVIAAVNNPRYREEFGLPRELGSYVGIIDAITHGGTQYSRR
ncbi:hypothetical protein HYV86_01125 [Candidatus Woesearchaeota archaeon]|nr:hypothetical protein [Candidatus Woesearchaeota archaeon]